jgi:uncharacterized membrane protein YkvA (DUF1232 family)
MKWLTHIIDWIAFPYGIMLLLKDHDIPGKTKIKAGSILVVLFLYILNPADLIPDVTPIIGLLEDLLLIPGAMFATRKMIPEINVPELVKKARTDTRRFVLLFLLCVSVIVLISISSLALLIYLAVRYWN